MVCAGTAALADVVVRECWTTNTTTRATTRTTPAGMPLISVRRRRASRARAATSAARFSSIRRRAAARFEPGGLPPGWVPVGTGDLSVQERVVAAAERQPGPRPAGQGERDQEQGGVAG